MGVDAWVTEGKFILGIEHYTTTAGEYQVLALPREQALPIQFRTSNLISSNHTSSTTCSLCNLYATSGYLILSIICQPRVSSPPNVANFSFFRCACLVLFVLLCYTFTWASAYLIFLSYLPSVILALPNPKMSPTFHFFDAHIWSYLHVFGLLSRGLTTLTWLS